MKKFYHADAHQAVPPIRLKASNGFARLLTGMEQILRTNSPAALIIGTAQITILGRTEVHDVQRPFYSRASQHHGD